MAGSAGSEGLNGVMGASPQEMMDRFATSPLLTRRLEPALSPLDVAGYNYLTARHAAEHTAHPDRVVVGSETFPPEIGTLWPIVERNPHVIGDFTWTGWDYVGEAGIGIYHYGANRKEQGWYPDRLAYCGDITINGDRRPVSYLRELAYGLRKKPYLAVVRLNRQGLPYDKNNWKYEDAIHSWTFPGHEGEMAKVLVLAGCQEVELFINGKRWGRKTVGESQPFTAVFEVPYQPGELKAVGYEREAFFGEDLLTTAGPVTALQVTVSKKQLEAGGQGLAFLTVDLVDACGRRNCWESKEVSVQVSGAVDLMGFGSANPSCEGSYQDLRWPTFDGRVMAVVRSKCQPGAAQVTFSAEGCIPVTLDLQVVNRLDEPRTACGIGWGSCRSNV